MQRFAFELRKLRNEAGGMTYRVLAQRAGYGVTALSQAAAGEQLPTLPVVLAYVEACGGDLAEWEARWKQAVDEAASSSSEYEEGGEPPYRGLARFEPGDSGRFFGRDKLSADLLDLMRRQRFAAVFGPSGSGKSSLLRAGLIPALQHTEDADLRPAAIRILTPGQHPARTHARLLDPGNTKPGSPGADTFVIVDQFEEIFTLCHDPAERTSFLDLLLTARQPTSRLRVLIAVRADFYGRCAEHRDLADALRDANLLVGPMSPAELRAAIVKPAAAEGLTVERALTARLVGEVADAPGGLPLLSHVLLETWRCRRGKTMTLAGYQAVGGMEGAVAKTAEDIYRHFAEDQAAAARRLLLRLVAPGEGTPDTRRPADRKELEAQGRQESETDQVLEAFARARLLTLDGDTVDLAHEALLTAWPRLHGWIEQDRERLRVHRKLTEAARAWDELGCDAGALYRGTRLATAEETFTPERQDHLSALEHTFLTTSATARDQEERAAARTTRRLRTLTVTLSVLLALAVATSLIAWQQSRISDQRRQEADGARQVTLARQLAAESANLISANSDLASLLASQTARARPTPRDTEGRDAGSTPPPQRRIELSNDGRLMAFSPDGTALATAGSKDGTVRLWDTQTGRLRTKLTGLTRGVTSMAFSPDSTALATAGSKDGTVRLWDTQTGCLRTKLTGHTRGVTSMAFELTYESPILATSSKDGTVRLWETRTGRLRTKLTGQTDAVLSVAFSLYGNTLAVAGAEGGVKLWDVTAGRVRTSLPDNSAPVFSMVFGQDDNTLATAGTNEGIDLWDVDTGQRQMSITGLLDIKPSKVIGG
ncbi:nSTAND1 domain-containing NTPase [Streptomyces mirabilis]|uniref:nSTAND1 domain-containing NTPase n=1 Tax=Streptomyces mirabilis TaxID=68239 RepID=UPI0036905A94